MSALLVTDAPPAFRLAAAAAASWPSELRRELGKAVRAEVAPVAKRLYAQHPGAMTTGNRLPYALVNSLKVNARSGVITGFTFGSTRRMRGGATLTQLARAIEFGARGGMVRTYERRSKRGGTHTVKRNTMTAFQPRRAMGRNVWPATYEQVAPRVLAVWTGIVFRFVGEVSA